VGPRAGVDTVVVKGREQALLCPSINITYVNIELSNELSEESK